MKIPNKPLDITIDDGNGLGYWGYIKHVIANYGNGTGRASRAEYWAFFTFILGAMFIPMGLGLMVGDGWPLNNTHLQPLLVFGPALLLAIPLISITARRFHDIGWSGWWAATNLWPVCISVSGQRFENAYGPHPKSKLGAYSHVQGRTFFSALREGMNSMAWLS